MTIAQELLNYLNTPYDYHSSPVVKPETPTVNCQRLIHVLYQTRFGVTLPSGLWSAEIFSDEIFFRDLEPDKEPLQEGDILIFAPKKVSNPQKFHLTFFTGEVDQPQDPILIHASAQHGKVTTDSLTSLLKTPQYTSLKKIKRLQPPFFDTHVLPVIRRQKLATQPVYL